MARESIGVLAGLAVLASGAVTLVALAGDPAPAVVGPANTTSTSIVATGATSTSPIMAQALPGVPAEVQRLLFWSGDAQRAGMDQLAELPPAVSRVLIDYGATLRVAEPSGVGSSR